MECPPYIWFINEELNLCLCMSGGAVLALLLAGYFAQQYLPPPKPKVVGIDLGMAERNCLSNVAVSKM